MNSDQFRVATKQPLTAFGMAFALILLASCSGSPPTNAPGVVGVGERTELGKIALTVNSAEFQDQIGEGSLPGAGNRFLTVGVKLENNTEYKLIYNRYQFSVVDAQGNAHSAIAVPGEPGPLQASTLDAKKDVTGRIVFKVPATANALTLRYQVPGNTEPLLVSLLGENSTA